jgi:DNA-binding HxlR family transcriptional regulator
VRYDASVGDPTPETAADPVPANESYPPDVFSRACTSRVVLQHISGRWGALTLSALRDEPLRFNALRRRIDGISEKMLSQTLQALERDGFVVREVQATIPPRVEYSLTPLGTTVAGQLLELISLLESSMDQVSAAQQAYDAR